MDMKINGQAISLDVPGDMPLLWALRDVLNFTGTKYGCGAALCGACTIHVDGVAMRSCVTPVSAAVGKEVRTIEGLNDKVGTAVKGAWAKLSVPQCGYCQSGQIMSATALLSKNKSPSAAESGNICRCGTYQHIIGAIKEAAGSLT